jgi:hypothetical protein
MDNLPLTDPTLAKQVWESMPNASTRRVARKLRQAGASISHMTVARWRNQRWPPSDGEQQHPLEVALASLDDAVSMLTGDVLSASMPFVRPGGLIATSSSKWSAFIWRRSCSGLARPTGGTGVT